MSDDPALDKLKKQIKDAQKAAHLVSLKKDKPQNLAGKFFNVGVELVSGVFVGVGLGLFIDWVFGTSPWGLLFFFMLGSGAGFLNVYRVLGAQEKKGRKKDIHG